ncbi:MAG: pitrilysin family protein [Polyangiaceae bacterium]
MRATSLFGAMVFLGTTSVFAAPPPLARHECPNGLSVIVVESHAVPLITVEIAAKNGSMTETPEFNGLSHLYEHMFFKANAAIPSQEAYSARAQELGLSWNGTTGTERVNYFFTTTSDHYGDAMVFMRDAIVSPLFDQTELEKERKVVLGEIDRNEANPYYHFSHEVEKRVWFKYPSRKDPLGSRDTVSKATADMMRTIQKRYYIPNNAVLVVTGDVDPKRVFDDADKLFANWQKGEDPFVKNPLVKHPALPKSEVVVVTQPVEGYTGEFVYHGPSTVGEHVDLTYAADLLTVAISEPSSRFQKNLVESGACVSAGLSWFTQMNTGPITVSFEAAPDKIDACIKAVQAELPKLAEKDYLSAEELSNAAHTIEVQTVRERERLSSYAHTLTFWWTSAGIDYYLGYVDNVKKATQTDIAQFMKTYVLGKNFVFGSLVSPAMVKAGFDEEHFASLAGLPTTKKKEQKKAPPSKKGG